ncbi:MULTISPECIES: SCO6745 family protein [unclassified Streptomyces]|uniref:SCO6745 family protein n=1 Tax=unclassified Streptomyces TaxID=2593676 RepID=UPI003865E85A
MTNASSPPPQGKRESPSRACTGRRALQFSPEAHAAYAALGVESGPGYFASRAAALGPVAPDVVIAAFYNISPQAVRATLPAAWRTAPPEEFLAARLAGIDATLRRILGAGVLASEELRRAAELGRRAAESTPAYLYGRPLFAAHAALPWPDEPHLVLWHAQTLLREFWGDGHVAALLDAGVSGIEALVTHAAAGPVGAEALRTTRAWSPDDWAAAVEGLRTRGWLASGPELAFTAEGKEWRSAVEAATDRLAAAPYIALGRDGCAELRDLVRPWSRSLVTELMPWAAARLKD